MGLMAKDCMTLLKEIREMNLPQLIELKKAIIAYELDIHDIETIRDVYVNGYWNNDNCLFLINQDIVNYHMKKIFSKKEKKVVDIKKNI